MANDRLIGLTVTLASLILSLVISAGFYFMAIQKEANSKMYTYVDAVGGSIFVFILSMIVSFSLVPSLVERFNEKKELT